MAIRHDSHAEYSYQFLSWTLQSSFCNSTLSPTLVHRSPSKLQLLASFGPSHTLVCQLAEASRVFPGLANTGSVEKMQRLPCLPSGPPSAYGGREEGRGTWWSSQWLIMAGSGSSAVTQVWSPGEPRKLNRVWNASLMSFPMWKPLHAVSLSNQGGRRDGICVSNLGCTIPIHGPYSSRLACSFCLFPGVIQLACHKFSVRPWKRLMLRPLK